MDARLVMFKTNGQRRDFPLVKDIVIGRAESCDLQIPLSSVSRRHCGISVSGNTIALKDLKSSNGTYVNNEQVDEVELKPGDRVLVGPTVFTLQVDGIPAEIEPAQAQGPVLQGKGKQEGPAEPVEVLPEAEDDEVTDEELAAVLGPEDPSDEDLDPMSALEALAADAIQADQDDDESEEAE